MAEIGLATPASGTAHDLDEALVVVERDRPARSSSGPPTSWAAAAPASPSTLEEFRRSAALGLDASPISEILIEKSIAGWKEFELEVMRDRADNCVIICSIENLDPMGVHTGDSITVAPAQTLSDVEYQLMRDAAFACIRRVGVETGGSNVQFAVNPDNGDMVVIEMNPRVSRSSALASKATGFPIAKIAARLAVGYTLDEIPNDITKKTPASFEPTIDYVVTKIPRWAFEKFPGTTGVLGTQMQSVGEAMAIGRTFPESLQKGLRSLEQGRLGLNCDPGEAQYDDLSTTSCCAQACIGTPDRPFQLEAVAAPGHDASTRSTPSPGSTRGSSTRCSLITEEREHLAGIGFERMDAAGRGGGPSASGSPTPSWPTSGASTRPTVRAARIAAGVRAHLQDRRHLRRRVRGRDAVPLLDLRGRRRGRARPTGRRS